MLRNGVLEKLLQINTICNGVRFESSVGILGVPFDKGQGKKGVAKGPDAIRKANLIEELKSIDNKQQIKDFGNLKYEVCNAEKEVENMKKYAHVAACTNALSAQVEEIIRNGHLCVTLGGDHSIGIGTVDGHIKAKSSKDVCVLWIDAHADLNTNKTSESGNIHGMPLALLCQELSDYWPYLPGMDWQQPVIPVRNIAYIGLRSVDPFERLIIEKLNLTAFGMDDIEDLGINTILQLALNRIDPQKNKSIHVSFDIDSLDPLEAPSTGTSVRGGLSLREGIQIMEIINRTGRLTAVDLVEVNPEIGTENDVKKTVEAAVHLLKAACGFRRSGMPPRHTDELPLQTFPPTRPTIS